MNCTRCNKELKDLKIEVGLSVYVERIKENGVTEQVPNSNTNSREILCFECFEEFSKALENLNYKYEEDVKYKNFKTY